jgi:signal transduction histidine kinase
MQHTAGLNRIINIVRTTLFESTSTTILSSLACQIATLLPVEACVLISHDLNTMNYLDFGWWHGEEINSQEKDLLFQYFDLLKIEVVRAFSNDNLSIKSEESIERDLQAILPGKIFLSRETGFQGQRNGTLILMRSYVSSWNSSETELLQTISESMAIAISQAQLQEQTQIKTRYQNLLNHLSREIGQSSNPDSLLDLCLAEIGRVLQIDRAYILMLKYQDPFASKRNRKKIEATVQITRGWSNNNETLDLKSPFKFDLKTSSACQEALKVAPEAFTRSQNYSFPDLPGNELPEKLNNESNALLMMPLMGKKTSDGDRALVLGFLVLQQDLPRLWLPDELDLVEWIGIQIATATIHHQTLDRVQSLVDERTAQLRHAMEFQAKLSEKMRHQIEQLQKLHELKDDFLNSMSHELKTPLTSMKMAIKMLRQPELSEAMREKYLNILEQEWNREYNLIKDLLTLQQVESGEFNFQPQEFNLDLLIDRLSDSFTQKWESSKGLTLHTEITESARNLYSDPESIEHILSELLANAGKYSTADTDIYLTVNSQNTLKGKNIEIAIANYGTGITPEELPHVFDKFRRGKGVTDRAVPGTGLGLTLVKYLVEHLNGTISVTSLADGDSDLFKTTFTIKLSQVKLN